MPSHRSGDTLHHSALDETTSPTLNRRQWLLHAIALVGGAVAAQGILEDNADADEHHLTKSLEKLIDREWHGKEHINDKMFAEIAAVGMQKFYETRKKPQDVFFSPEEIRAGKDVCCCCSDEGNTEVLNDTGEKMMLLRSPGSGILDALDLEDKDPFHEKFIEEKAQAAVDSGVTKFCSHVGCGAAKAIFEERVQWLRESDKGAEADDLEQEGPEAFAKRWAVTVAARMQRIAKNLGVSHANAIHAASIDTLHRPKEIHVARIIYVTDDDALDSSYPEFPQGFVERTGGEKLDKVLRHVDILRRIGFHETHGFGTKFSAKTSEQFVICCIANEPHRLEAVMAHARRQVSTLEPAEARRKIRVDGFIRNR